MNEERKGQHPKADANEATAINAAASTPSMWFLQPLEAQSADEPIALAGQMSVGRDPSSAIVLASNTASRAHAQLSIQEGELFVEDLGSSNGTYLNGQKITSLSKVAAGDQLRFDTIAFSVTGPASSQPEQVATEMRPVASVPGPDAAAGGNWWEKADQGPKGTSIVDVSEMQQKAEGGTMIMQGVAVEKPTLICVSPPYAGKTFAISEGKTTIGRADNNDIVLDDNGISSRHAQIVYEDNTWKVVDLLSKNGIRVNGKKTQSSFLGPGDSIKMGRIELRFVIDPEMAKQVLRAATGEKPATTAPATSSGGGLPSWVFIAIGFLAVVAIGAIYMLLFR